ncbi:SAC3 family 1 [Hyphodiscus hymeniophilus]|uniref:SAC3 family 1 n=1 Tax=Hyphodiscus hymeniophilus TaxID=353542 RepID=A0A9P7AWL6_9HELO|nr:SAC3 family 1 [Hyphodiscus hymeniophilus]
MLLRGSNTRGTRGQSPNRSRGSSRGRGSTSRGASNSSGKSKLKVNLTAPTSPRALREAQHGYQRSNHRGRNPKSDYKNNYSNYGRSGTSPTENSPGNFEAERLENAAKREQRGINGATVKGRGARGNQRGSSNNKQVRFANPLGGDNDEKAQSKSPSPAPSNAFTAARMSSPFGPPARTTSNPFAASSSSASNNPFAAPTSSSSPFGAPSQPSSTSNVFGKPSGPPAATNTLQIAQNVFGAPSNISGATSQENGIFSGAFPIPSSTTPSTNPFGAPQGPSIFSAPAKSQAFGVSSAGHQSSTTATPSPAFNPFGAPAGLEAPSLSTVSSPRFTFGTSGSKPAVSKPSSSADASQFGSSSQSGPHSKAPPKPPPQTNKPTTFGAKSNNNGFGSKSTPATRAKTTRPSAPPAASNTLAQTMDQLLRKQHLLPPPLPTPMPGDPKQKTVVHAFWQTYKGYRAKVRESLIRAALLDDPDKPKKLSEAIDFKGTCEDMCPDFERITRIVERDVQGPEKELGSDGTMWPAPEKMIKALARSAAGQDAPLPMDVRSPAALRRTFDYLLHTVLGEDGDLSAVHGFLWDRTRAIRRDFVFQSSMNQAELSDQIYCLERITRFHVIALHQMSREEVVAEDFSEQQEIEQLGKALLSLIHTYEDCQAQGIDCENEAEFRAYYVLFNSHNTGILETVQDWGWKFWGESEQIKIAVSLVETLQNIWDTRGPLRPHSATDIAQNGVSRFFSIVGDSKVSYTMACFAEIHFNAVRKSAFKTILAAYRKQRDQSKDWTLTKLNEYLRFDDEEDIIEFGEAYGLQFQENDGETYLSIESDEPSDPFPPLKQRHSYSLVEVKRGDRSLPTAIDATVYDEGQQVSEEVSDEDSLFVKDTSAKDKANSMPTTTIQEASGENSLEDGTSQEHSTIQTPTSTPTYIFSQPSSQPTFGQNFFTPKPAEPSSAMQTQTPQGSSPSISSSSTQATPSIFAPIQQPQVAPTPPFSFLNQPVTAPATGNTQTPPPLQAHIFGAGPPPGTPKPLFQSAVGATAPVETPKPFFSLGQQSSAASTTMQSPNPQLSLGGYSVTPPIPSSLGEPKLPASTPNSTQQLPLPSQEFGKGSIYNPVSQSTFNSTPTPQSKPSPVPSFSNPSAGRPDPSAAAKLAAEKRIAQFDNLARWVFVGNGGVLDQFIEHEVEGILHDAVAIYLKEELDRKTKEEATQAREVADKFRYRSLAVKYGQKWRTAAHRLWMRRKGREARKARQEMAESLRASKVLQSTNVVQDFRASANSSRRGSLESLLDATGVLDGVHDPNNEIRAIVRREEPKIPSKQRNPSRSTNSPASSTNGHRRGKSDNPFRRSLLSDPTYLHGGSRIHLMSKYDARDETRQQISGVQTDYFRLKARGISTLPDGTPLANSVAKDTLHKKRSFDTINKPTTPQKSLMPPPAARSVPVKPAAQNELVWKGADSSEVIQAMKARARALIGEESRHNKRSFDEDEELFARAKRVREQMDEGSEWYSKQIEEDTMSRSVS